MTGSEILLLSILLYTFVFLLVSSINGAMWREPRKVNSFLPSAIWGFTSVCGLWLFYRLSHVFGSEVSGSRGDAFGQSLGLIGLIVTVVTGLTIASAWRAKDQVETAEARINRAISDIDKRSLSLIRTIASQEVLSVQLKRGPSNNTMAELTMANLLQVAISASALPSTLTETFVILGSISEPGVHRDLFRTIFSERSAVSDWLEKLLEVEELSQSEKAVLHRLLAAVTSASTD